MPARILPHGTPLPDDHPLRMGMMITPIPRKPAMATPDAAVLFESNPVLAAEWIIRDLRADPVRWAAAQPVLDEPIARLFHAGHGLPEAPLRSWSELGVLGAHLAKAPEPWRPGVLGLVHGQLAECVVPLEVEPAPAWRIAPQLPLAQDRLVDLLVALLHEAKRLEPGVLPEARAFVIETKFPWSCSGTSMDVAAVLAILRRTAPPSPLLDRACAVVEPEGSRLRPVAEVEAKLRAFVRECGRGSLLVRHPDCRASAAVAASFDHVWDVPDLATLAAHLAREGWFDAWTSKGPHGLAEAELVLARLRSLQQGVPDHRATVQFARRALSCTWSEGVPPAIRQRPRLELLRSLRHLGSYADALQVGEQWLREVHDLGEASCTEQLAEADLEFAAGLFDLADFERMHAVLRPWLQRIDADPLGLSPVLRTRLWNTAARALVQLGREGWEALFLRSLALQAKTEPGSMPRTRNYLVEGLLRNGRLDDAAARIAENEQSGPDAMSSAMLRFHRAELSRRRGLVWVDPAAECEQPDVRRANHPLGLYLQATARQPGRTAADAVQRFAAAGACFAFDAQRTGEANVLWVLARLMELAAALGAGGDASAATRALATALAQPGLEKLCARLGPVPCTPSQVEPFLAQLPWT